MDIFKPPPPDNISRSETLQSYHLKKRSSFWINFSAILQIIIGSLLCFSLLTILLGIFLIITGVFILSIGKKYANIHTFFVFKNILKKNGSEDFFDSINKFFIFYAILLILIILSYLIILFITSISLSSLIGLIKGISDNISTPTYLYWQY